ncbi:MAG: Hsp20/alpha crystallin family protein [Proteobacteria bacterium]|nr:Hsp20/alpha crystallin family protein [Pseudomonadota bacterium]
MGSLELWRNARNGPFSLLRNWDSMTKDLDSFFGGLDRSMDELRTETKDLAVAPACDVQEDEKSFLLSFDMPGFKREDVAIELMGNRITVAAKRVRETAGDGAKFHRLERTYGEFKRVFTLPDNARADAVEANYENGVLYLVIPKAEIEKPKKVEITEGKGGFAKKLIGLKSEDEGKKTASS